jgi:two-component system, NtrC family, response regulator AtoC
MNDKKRRVLIVDDEEDLTWSIAKGLARDRDLLDVVCVNSGCNALNALSEHDFDLVVTDIRMPDINGWTLLKEARRRYPWTRFIVMTAYGSMEAKDEIMHSGIRGYIEKPFEINDLRKLIHSSLKENGEHGRDRIQAPVLE